MLLKEGKHKLDFRDEYSIDVPGNGCYGQNLSEIQCYTGQFYLYYVAIQDNKDGDIKIVGLLAGDE